MRRKLDDLMALGSVRVVLLLGGRRSRWRGGGVRGLQGLHHILHPGRLAGLVPLAPLVGSAGGRAGSTCAWSSGDRGRLHQRAAALVSAAAPLFPPGFAALAAAPPASAPSAGAPFASAPLAPALSTGASAAPAPLAAAAAAFLGLFRLLGLVRHVLHELA